MSGSRVIRKTEIPSMGVSLVKGLVLLEGSFPVDHLNPALKHVVHYGPQTGDVGVLDWFAMFCFERKNKQVKGMVKNTVVPLASLANHVELDILAKLDVLSREDSVGGESPDFLILKVPMRRYRLSEREKNGMRALGITSFQRFQVFQAAHVLGVHFRGGEWGCHRCGSVIATIYRGVSRYCILKAFIQVQGKVYASVTWLSAPIYPYPHFKIVVKVRMMTPEQERVHRGVISVDRIEPCAVAVLPDEDGVHYYMLRDKGIDR